MGPVHLFLKIPNENLNLHEGQKIDTILEHKRVFEEKNRLIWGQASNRKTNLLSLENQERFCDQIKEGIPTYAFFLAGRGDEKELYAGKMTNIYKKGSIGKNSEEINYIPPYQSEKIGTDDDNFSFFVDLESFEKIDIGNLNHITLERNNKAITSFKNANSVFIINIDDELKNILEKTPSQNAKDIDVSTKDVSTKEENNNPSSFLKTFVFKIKNLFKKAQ